jgi:hypothetical protein
MKDKNLWMVAFFLALAAVAVVFLRGSVHDEGSRKGTALVAQNPHDSHAATPRQSARVPAFQTTAAELQNLPPTLPSSQFVGKTRDAYRVAKEIPQTLAQLPCYCECDRGYGHKSLHTCFVDDHASHCAVCVDEALLAYRLQKEEKLTPDEVRNNIIEKYSAAE